MVDEPFDYKAWKSGKIVSVDQPSIRALGTDAAENVVMEVSVPEKGDVYVDVLNANGDLVWRMHADDLEQGVHQVVWDGFSQPGLYNMYVKGMGWDAEREMVIYT
jgi:flagellar hook assembly protein FlgD